jgi:hypothetical protein
MDSSHENVSNCAYVSHRLKRSSGPGSLVLLPSDEVGYKYKYEIYNVQILRGSVLPDGLGFESMF